MTNDEVLLKLYAKQDDMERKFERVVFVCLCLLASQPIFWILVAFLYFFEHSD